MWTILKAELKYRGNVSAGVYLAIALALAAAAASGVFDEAARQGRNAAFLFLFTMFLGHVLTLLLNPSPREQRDRLLVPLPLPVWQTALAPQLVQLAHWLGYCLLFGAAFLLAPAAFRWTPQAGAALAAQSGLVLMITAVGELHFIYAWPAFRKQPGIGPLKVVAVVLMGVLWLEIYLLSLVQLLGLIDCFRQNNGTLLCRLFQTPAAAAGLLLAGLALHLLLAAAHSRRRSFVQG
jgi:hypothetical protein